MEIRVNPWLNSGRKEYDFRETDIAELVRNTLDSYRYQIEQQGFAFEEQIDTSRGASGSRSHRAGACQSGQQCTVLGAVPFALFERGSVQVAAGDLLLACSDGILESFNEAGQEFGNQRLEAELRRAQGGSAESVLFSVLGAVQDFAAPRPLTDDITLVVIRGN